MRGGVMSLSMSSNRFTWDGLEQGEEGGADGGHSGCPALSVGVLGRGLGVVAWYSDLVA